MARPKKYKIVQIAVEPAVWEQLKMVSDVEQRPVAGLVRIMMRQFVAKRQDAERSAAA